MLPWLTLPVSLSCLLNELRPCFTGAGILSPSAAWSPGWARGPARMLHLDVDRMIGLVQDSDIRLRQGLGPASAGSGACLWGGSGAAAEQEIVNAGSTAGG